MTSLRCAWKARRGPATSFAPRAHRRGMGSRRPYPAPRRGAWGRRRLAGSGAGGTPAPPGRSLSMRKGRTSWRNHTLKGFHFTGWVCRSWGWGAWMRRPRRSLRPSAVLRAIGNKSLQFGALHDLALTERQRGNLPRARTLIEESLQIAESLRSDLVSLESRTAFLATVYMNGTPRPGFSGGGMGWHMTHSPPSRPGY